MPVISDLSASHPDPQGFWVKERSTLAAENREEAVVYPLSPYLLHVDFVRESRSAQYRRNKAKNKAKFARAQELKQQGQPRRGYPAQRRKGAKRSGKRQPILQDLDFDPGTDCEQSLLGSVFAPASLASGNRPIPTLVSPKSQPPAEKASQVHTPPDVYTTVAVAESPLDIPAPDIAREFRSYERHRHQTKKNARFTQSRQKKGARITPARGRGSKSAKTKNLRGLVALAIIDEGSSSEDDVQTPIEVSLSHILSDIEHTDAPAPPTVDMETLITTAKTKYTKGLPEPCLFEFAMSD